MTGGRIIVGPEAMRVERDGVSSDTVPLTGADGPAEIRAIAARLWEAIRPLVSWRVWVRHRLAMAWQRALTAHVQRTWPGPYHRGPRPDLIALRPWTEAARGEWTSLPHGVVSLLMLEERA